MYAWGRGEGDRMVGWLGWDILDSFYCLKKNFFDMFRLVKHYWTRAFGISCDVFVWKTLMTSEVRSDGALVAWFVVFGIAAQSKDMQIQTRAISSYNSRPSLDTHMSLDPPLLRLPGMVSACFLWLNTSIDTQHDLPTWIITKPHMTLIWGQILTSTF